MSGAAIEVERLVKRFPQPRGYRDLLLHPRRKLESTALRGVSFSVDRGEIFGLLGPNGAGKTTLIKILCTLIVPTEGKAYVNGYDVVRHPGIVRRSIGYVVSDERSFYWRLTGRQNLRFFATLNNLVGREGERRVEESIRLAGLEREIDRLFLYYSTGTKQKMAIARGLITDPPILLLDEPTRSLDLPTARSLRRFIKERLSNDGRTVLITTHNMEEAAELCERVAVIDRGQLKAWGTPTEIAETVAWPRRRLLLEIQGWSGDILARLQALPSVQEVRTEDAAILNGDAGDLRVEVRLRDGPASVSQVIESVVLAGGKIMSCREDTPTLAELVLRVTGHEEAQ